MHLVFILHSSLLSIQDSSPAPSDSFGYQTLEARNPGPCSWLVSLVQTYTCVLFKSLQPWFTPKIFASSTIISHFDLEKLINWTLRWHLSSFAKYLTLGSWRGWGEADHTCSELAMEDPNAIAEPLCCRLLGRVFTLKNRAQTFVVFRICNLPVSTPKLKIYIHFNQRLKWT